MQVLGYIYISKRRNLQVMDSLSLFFLFFFGARKDILKLVCRSPSFLKSKVRTNCGNMKYIKGKKSVGGGWIPTPPPPPISPRSYDG